MEGFRGESGLMSLPDVLVNGLDVFYLALGVEEWRGQPVVLQQGADASQLVWMRCQVYGLIFILLRGVGDQFVQSNGTEQAGGNA